MKQWTQMSLRCIYVYFIKSTVLVLANSLYFGCRMFPLTMWASASKWFRAVQRCSGMSQTLQACKSLRWKGVRWCQSCWSIPLRSIIILSHFNFLILHHRLGQIGVPTPAKPKQQPSLNHAQCIAQNKTFTHTHAHVYIYRERILYILIGVS